MPSAIMFHTSDSNGDPTRGECRLSPGARRIYHAVVRRREDGTLEGHVPGMPIQFQGADLSALRKSFEFACDQFEVQGHLKRWEDEQAQKAASTSPPERFSADAHARTMAAHEQFPGRPTSDAPVMAETTMLTKTTADITPSNTPAQQSMIPLMKAPVAPAPPASPVDPVEDEFSVPDQS